MIKTFNRIKVDVEKRAKLRSLVFFDKFVFYFSIFDILFFPYFPLIATNYSIFIIFIWYFLNFKRLYSKDIKISIILLLFFIFGSNLISFIIHPIYIQDFNVQRNTITKTIQYLSYLVYFSLFKYFFKTYNINLKTILYFFLIFILLFGLIYLIDISLYASLKIFWNKYDIYTEWFFIFGESLPFRYSFIWSDPNNPAYAFASLVFFLIQYYNPKFLFKILLIFSSLFISIISMSSGASISILITLFILFLVNINYKNIFHFEKSYLFFIVIFILLSSFFIFFEPNFSLNLGLLELGINRILNNFVNDSSGSRITIWSDILQKDNIFNYLFVGHGPTTIIDGVIRRTHSGQLYLIYSFGIPAALIYIHFLFYRKNKTPWKNLIFTIPTLIGFTINTILGEQKFLILHLLLIAYVSYNIPKKYIIIS
jgi:hypothetical protein